MRQTGPDRSSQLPAAPQGATAQNPDTGSRDITVSKLPEVSVARDWLDRGPWVFDALLVIVGLLQLVVLYRQSKLMGTHADHLKNLATAANSNASAAWANAEGIKESVKAQKAIERQWVTFENWAIRGENPVIGRQANIFLSFKVVNPTKTQLRLRHVEVFINGDKKISSPNIMLTPQYPYSAQFELTVSEHDTIAYVGNSARLHIFGNIAFVDHFGDRQNQIFGEVCSGGINGFHFSQFEGWVGTDENDEDS
jgi:hypothetical protein